MNSPEGIRLAKRVAEILKCSRAEAEQVIVGGWVKVNQVVVDEPAHRVTDEAIDFLTEDPWRLYPDVVGNELHITVTPQTPSECGVVGKLRDRTHRLILNLRWWVVTHTSKDGAPRGPE
jgi:hypothetical protein